MCQDNFTTKSKLEDHIQEAHKFKCNECDKTEETKENLDKHVKESHTADIIEVEAYECSFCDYEGNNFNTMMEHSIEKHKEGQG